MILTCCKLGYSQVSCDFFDDYSDPAPWNYVYIYPGVAPCSLDPLTGSLDVSGGTVNFVNVNDGNDTRVHRDLGFTLSNEAWTANFEFTPTAIGPTGTAATGHVIFALTAGDNCPFNDSTYHCIVNDQDAITVWYLSTAVATPVTTGFYIYAKNELAYVTSYGVDWITAGVAQTYYMTLKRIATNYVTLEAYTDPDRTILFGSIDCFEILDDITDLHVLQHANAPWGFYTRKLTGTIDNTCIYDDVVETAYIIGPDTICSGMLGEYILSGGGDDVDWTLPAGVFYNIGVNGILNITDWGGYTSVTINANINSLCAPYTISYDVIINDAFFSAESITICTNDTILVFGIPVSDSGIFSESYVTASGCDSTHTITVTAIDTLFSSETITICSNDTVLVFGI